MSEDAIRNAAQKLQDKLDAASNIPAPLATSLVETFTEVLTNVRATFVSTLQSVESLTEQKGNALPIEEVIEWLGQFFFFFLIVCFTSYFVFSCIAVLPQSWGSELPSIVETRDQNSWCCPLLFSNRNLGSFCA